jgi:hypothetical protein
MNKFCHVYDLEEHNELGKGEYKIMELKREVQYLDGNKYAVLINASIKAWSNCNFYESTILANVK